MKKKWWHEKVAYQIYPKSFLDTNGDGIGDLRGIIGKLDYLKALGVDIVWLSPVYKSPFVDQGYDIADYYAIDPVFGDMKDMEKLLEEAKKRNMHILMDLVVNHCSDQHEWFQKALQDPYGEYGQYFYFREGKDGEVPCNWRSYFGGSVWEPVPGYENLYYLHMFAKEQPDLNWENPKVREEVYKNIRWWLEKGLAGFRIDAIINIKKDLEFRDYPADRADGLCSPGVMLKQVSGVHEFLMEMKEKAFAPYEAFTIGELFEYKPEELALYIGENGCFESVFDFEPHLVGASREGWFAQKPITPNAYRDAVAASKKRSGMVGMMANIIENHDEPRGVSRYIPESDIHEISKKMLGGLMMFSYGLPFLYQGQELGMTNTVFEDVADVDDINTKDEYEVALANGLSAKEALAAVGKNSRDNARTPMQWSTEANAGFTTGTPWLKVNPNYKEINASDQLQREDSVFAFYKEMIALRKNEKYKKCIVYGEQIPAFAELDNLMAFYRQIKEQTLLVIGNYQSQERQLELSDKVGAAVANNYKDVQLEGQMLNLKGYQFLVLEIEC